MIIRYLNFLVVISLLSLVVNVSVSWGLDQNQMQVREFLLKLTDDELLQVRAINNSFSKHCEWHPKRNAMERFSQVVAQVVVIDRGYLTDPSSIKHQYKYGFFKGQAMTSRKRMGNNSYCDCVYKYIMRNDSTCFR